MLHCVYSKQADRWGVLDDTLPKLLIPFNYTKISIQKYGIIAYDDNGMGIVYQMDGTPIVRVLKNVLLLDNSTLLTSTDAGNCYIVDYVKHDYLCKLPLDSIKFFCGSNTKSKEYTAKTDFTTMLADPDYLAHGAYIENLVGVHSKTNHLWGIYDIKEQKLYADFNFKILIQCAGQQIGGIAQDGSRHMNI